MCAVDFRCLALSHLCVCVCVCVCLCVCFAEKESDEETGVGGEDESRSSAQEQEQARKVYTTNVDNALKPPAPTAVSTVLSFFMPSLLPAFTLRPSFRGWNGGWGW